MLLINQIQRIAFVILLGLISVACERSSEKVNQQNFTNVSIEEAYSIIEKNVNNSNFVIIDLRTPQEINYGFIKGAIFIDFMNSNFQQHFDQLDRNKVYLIYCQSGYRSDKTINLMKNAGFKAVYNMYAGFAGWYRKGYPSQFR